MSNLLDKKIKSEIDDAITLLTKFSVPLYSDINRKPTQLGTGFFVKKGKDCFLVSAAHVLDKSISHGLYYYATPDKIRNLSGRMVRSKITENRINDIIDIGVVKMTGGVLPPYPEVEKFAMDISDLKPSYVPRLGKHYIFLGFPSTKTKLNNLNYTIEATLYSYRSDSIPDSEYSKYGVSNDTHIVLPMDLRKGYDSNGNLVNFPKPQGMSGSPVIVLYELEDGSSRTFPVVGVAIEYRKPNKVVIAADVKYVLEAVENAK